MKRTIDQLIPRFAKIGLELAPVPDTTPQLWTVHDPITGLLEDFGGLPPCGGGNDLSTIRIHLYRNHSPMSLRETRVKVLFEQGKTMTETANILGCGWTTVAAYRKKLRLPAKEPRGPRKHRQGHAQGTHASREAERLLRAGQVPAADIARHVGLTRQRVCQIRDALGLSHWTRYGARREELAELVAEGVVDVKTLAVRVGCSVSQVRADGQAVGLSVETGRTRAANRRALVKQLSEQGWRPGDIAARIGCSLNMVIDDRAVLGVAPKRNIIGPKRVQERRAKVAALLDEGMSRTQICDRLSMPMQTVCADVRVIVGQGAAVHECARRRRSRVRAWV